MASSPHPPSTDDASSESSVTQPLYAVGVDLGGTNLKVALVERSGQMVRRATVPTATREGPHRVLDQIATGVERVCRELPDGAHLAGVGVGAPGTVSLDRATVRKPPNLPGWDELHMPSQLGRRLNGTRAEGATILVDNDANVAGLGSAFYGAGRPFPSFIMVTLGTGVGGAIIHENRVFRGANGGAGELGHISIDYEGPYARSGVAGAAEAYLGHHFLSRHARYQLLARNTRLHETAGTDLCKVTPKKLHAAAIAGDVAAQEVLDWAGHKLGVMLGSVINLLDIRKVVVGGGISQAGELLLAPARAAIQRFVMPALQNDVDLVRETRGNEVALLGAARLLFEHVEAEETETHEA